MNDSLLAFGFQNTFLNNMTLVLKNYSLETYYGVSTANINFIVTPDDPDNTMNMNNLVVVNTHFNFANAQREGHGAYDMKGYLPPATNRPLYIPELSIVLFKTLDERRDAILRYGSGNYVVESFATHILPIMNGAFKVTCCLSEKPYYGVFNREIYELPKSSPEYTTEAMQRHNITSDMLQTSDVFIVETILKQNYVGKTQPVSHEVKIIDRSQINVDEPIIFGNTGIVLFPTREAAQLWINNYSASIEQYLIDKAFEVVEDSHREDLEQFVKETKEDKHDMTMMFLAIGGSGIAGVLVDALLKLAVEKRNEKQGGEGGGGSSFLPTLGVIAGIGVIGLIAYLIWKNHHDKEEEQKKVAREQKEARLYRSKRKTI